MERELSPHIKVFKIMETQIMIKIRLKFHPVKYDHKIHKYFFFTFNKRKKLSVLMDLIDQ